MSDTGHMTSEGSSTVQSAIRQVLARHPSIAVAILFGSLVAGRERTDSDLDLAVASTAPLSPQARIQLMDELAVGLGHPVDLIDLSQTHGPLLQQILTKGRLIICTDRTQYANLLLRVVYEEADVMPYYRRILAERRQAWIGTQPALPTEASTTTADTSLRHA